MRSAAVVLLARVGGAYEGAVGDSCGILVC